MTDENQAPVTRRDLVEENIDKVFKDGPAALEQRSTDLALVATRPGFSVLAEELDAAKMMAMAGPFIPEFIRGNPGQCLAVIQLSKRWSKYDERTNSWISFDPIAIASCSYLVTSDSGNKQSVGYTSQFIGAIVDAFVPFASRMRYVYQGEAQERSCTAFASLRGDPQPFTYTTPPLRLITPKKSPLWQSDPDRQLAYYARRAWARLFTPGVLLGVYDVDELEGDPTQRRVHAVRDVTNVEGLHDRLKRAQAEAADQPVEGFTEDAVQNGLGEPPAAEESPAKATTRRRPPRAEAAQPARKRKAPAATEAAPKREKRASEAPKGSPKPKAAPKAQEAPKPRPLPTNPKQYLDHVLGWLAEIATEEGIEARWRSEMRLRNACGVVAEERNAIRLEIDYRIAALRQG